jgi:hypothetical protein
MNSCKGRRRLEARVVFHDEFEKRLLLFLPAECNLGGNGRSRRRSFRFRVQILGMTLFPFFILTVVASQSICQHEIMDTSRPEASIATPDWASSSIEVTCQRHTQALHRSAKMGAVQVMLHPEIVHP